jgi:trk system potassium uptake protein TrkH
VMLGPSAGSTGGSIKMVRHIIIAKMLRRELEQTVHPEAVRPLRLNGVPIGESTLQAIIVFVFLYLGVWAAAAVLILFDSALEDVHLTAFQSVAAAATTLGNAGPGLGFAGPMGSFAPFSDVSTSVMAMLMYLGRLELMTVLVLFTPQYWRI